MIHFFIGNHGYNIHTQDLLEYTQLGLNRIGNPLFFFFNKFTRDGINIVLEGFDDNLTNSILTFQFESPKSKLFIIASETLADNTFNSANNVQTTAENSNNHYENADYWKQRYDNFVKLLPVTSGVITIDKYQYEEYVRANLGVPIFYLPLVALPDYEPIKQLDYQNKDIDIYFSGTITEYRGKILKKFMEHGLHVVTASPRNPEYLRRHFLERTKLALGLKLSENTSLLSKARGHFYLTRKCAHLFEVVEAKSELDPFLSFATHTDMVLATLHRLSSECVFDENQLEEFKSAFSYQDVFSSLSQFFRDSPTRPEARPSWEA